MIDRRGPLFSPAGMGEPFHLRAPLPTDDEDGHLVELGRHGRVPAQIVDQVVHALRLDWTAQHRIVGTAEPYDRDLHDLLADRAPLVVELFQGQLGNLGSLPLVGELAELAVIQPRGMAAIRHPAAISIWRLGFLLLFDYSVRPQSPRCAADRPRCRSPTWSRDFIGHLRCPHTGPSRVKGPETNPSIALISPDRPTTLLRGIVRNQLRGRCAPSTVE